MPKLSLWNRQKGHTYKTMDRWISQMYTVGGTAALIHKYIGPVTAGTDNELVPNLSQFGDTAKELTIQDLFFLENRDRKYDENVYELRVLYQVTDQEFDLSQFGLFLPNDSLNMSFHINDTVSSIGRKLMAGDVIELPHMREEFTLDMYRPAVNKFYVITDVSKEMSGIAQTWWPHTLRVKVEALTDSQEFSDILDRELNEFNDGLNQDFGELTLRDVLSSYNEEIKISEELLRQAEENVPLTNFETAHLFIAPNEKGEWNDPWVFAGDGCPPNGAEILGYGNFFPETAPEGSWFLRTDYVPNVLFRKIGTCWKRQEVDYRRKWKTAHRLLEEFINNKNKTTYSDDTVHDQRVALSKAVKPKVDDLCKKGKNKKSDGCK